jgi:antitoxin ParD1/3/4
MSMVKKSISVTSQQSEWMKAQLAKGLYGNESEVIRDLIRERQMQQQETQQQETQEEITAIRLKLLEAERSGFTSQTVDQIWAAVRSGTRAG